MSYKATKPALVCFIFALIVLLFIRAPFYVLLILVGDVNKDWTRKDKDKD